jgi:SAM-dependent methyltransferase
MSPVVAGLEAQQALLSGVHTSDFRSANLWQLIGQQVQQGSVLDVGCGAGGMLEWLLARGYDARGIDSSERTIEVARAFLSRHGHDPERASAQPLSQLIAGAVKYDNVISMDCLEHIEDDRAAFAKLVELLAPRGRLLVTVPALPALYGERDRVIGHYRRYTAASLRALSEGQPLRIERVRYWNLLGVAPTYVSQRLLGRGIDESFRYGEPTLSKKLLRAALYRWFQHVENRVAPPLGMTVFMVAARV